MNLLKLAGTAVASGLLVLSAAAPSGATGAERTSFTNVFNEDFQGAIPECFDANLVGRNVGTDTVTGTSVQTPSGSYHVSGTEVFSYRVDFPNGMYSTGADTSHFTFTIHDAHQVYTQFNKENRTIYNSDGSVFGQVVFHHGTHITFQDLNGNGIPDPGELSSQVDQFFYTCH